jgi:hypothetical protein
MTNYWSTLKMSHDTVSDSAAQEHTVTIEMKGTREGFCVKTERINPGKDLLNLDLSKKKKIVLANVQKQLMCEIKN